MDDWESFIHSGPSNRTRGPSVVSLMKAPSPALEWAVLAIITDDPQDFNEVCIRAAAYLKQAPFEVLERAQVMQVLNYYRSAGAIHRDETIDTNRHVYTYMRGEKYGQYHTPAWPGSHQDPERHDLSDAG